MNSVGTLKQTDASKTVTVNTQRSIFTTKRNSTEGSVSGSRSKDPAKLVQQFGNSKRDESSNSPPPRTGRFNQADTSLIEIRESVQPVEQRFVEDKTRLREPMFENSSNKEGRHGSTNQRSHSSIGDKQTYTFDGGPASPGSPSKVNLSKASAFLGAKLARRFSTRLKIGRRSLDKMKKFNNSGAGTDQSASPPKPMPRLSTRSPLKHLLKTVKEYEERYGLKCLEGKPRDEEEEKASPEDQKPRFPAKVSKSSKV